MYTIDTYVIVKAPGNAVFSALKRMSDFSSAMKYVKKIKTTKISGNEMQSEWHIDVDGADVNWKEKNLFDDKNLNMSFSLLEGDYNEYFGKWEIEEDKIGTKLSIKVNIDWGIPSFEKVIIEELKKRTEKIIRGMIITIKKQSEKDTVKPGEK
jgi:ribosome-associated toxin RatA of RatAB toxin-antitoxin module